MLGGAGRFLNRSGSMNAPTNEGMIKAAKAVTTSMIKSSSTGVHLSETTADTHAPTAWCGIMVSKWLIQRGSAQHDPQERQPPLSPWFPWFVAVLCFALAAAVLID
jgi:hypothetical protein